MALISCSRMGQGQGGVGWGGVEVEVEAQFSAMAVVHRDLLLLTL